MLYINLVDDILKLLARFIFPYAWHRQVGRSGSAVDLCSGRTWLKYRPGYTLI